MGQPIKSSIEYEKFFSKEIKNIFEKAWDALDSYIINSEDFIYFTLSEPDSILYKAVNGFLTTFDIEKIQEKYSKIRSENNLISGVVSAQKTFSTEFKSILTKANEERVKYSHKLITSDHVLMALLKEGLAPEFKNKGLNYDRMVKLSKKMHDITDSLSDVDMPEEKFNFQTQIISFDNAGQEIFKMLNNMSGNQSNTSRRSKNDIPYCQNLNKEKLGITVGREREISKIVKVLGRKNCNNAVLVGDSGVGKTSIVYGLVNLINSKDCPSYLSGYKVFKFNPMDLISGTQLRGMFEERLNAVITALKKDKKNIFFIDDFHNIANDKHKADYDFVGGLSEILKSNDVKIIATTTMEGYKSTFENSEMQRCFQKVEVEKPTTEECLDIIKGILPEYEEFHRVKYTNDAVKCIISLAQRYITEKSLPSSAIDIMDEAGAKKKCDSLNPLYIQQKKREIEGLEKEKEKYLKQDNIKEVENINTLISGIQIMISEYIENLNKKEILGEITADDMFEAVAEHTNIPVSKLSENDKKKIKNIDKVLKSVVIGQDEALDEISRVIKRNKVGLFPGSKPIGSYMYIGGSGCGKTLTAKALAKEIFGDEKYLVRFDMSEYADKTAVNKLIGASAGYVGYDKGGLLTEAVKRKKHCVLLIDEIEKADEEVYNLFLQILDEGCLTDNVGYKVDFKNTIIIFTSNIGTKTASQSKAIGFDGDENLNRKSVIEKELKKKFPPEFINRLDKVIYFNILTDENLKTIISIELEKLKERLKGIECDSVFDDSVIDFIFNLTQKEREYGARPIVRAIQNEIENKIADMLLDNEDERIKISVKCEENKILVVIE